VEIEEPGDLVAYVLVDDLIVEEDRLAERAQEPVENVDDLEGEVPVREGYVYCRISQTRIPSSVHAAARA
jgi:hypothetical protein